MMTKGKRCFFRSAFGDGNSVFVPIARQMSLRPAERLDGVAIGAALAGVPVSAATLLRGSVPLPSAL
jgi:hypothetical protein